MIKEVDFEQIKEFKSKKFSPVLFIYEKEGFSVCLKNNQIDSGWELFYKIFLNRFYKDYEYKINPYFDQRLFQNDKSGGYIIFSHSDIKLNNTKQNKKHKVVKFSDNSYVKCFEIDFNNLVLLKKYIINDDFKVLKLFVCSNDDIGTPEFTKEYNKLVKKYKKYNIKKSVFVASHINGKILTEKEKLIKYVRKEFKTKKLIGDIQINEKQELILDRYMKTQLSSFNSNPIGFSPDYPRLFALGLVRYAMHNYNKKHGGEFWPYFREEYNVNIDGNKQKFIHNVFEEILKQDKLSYLEDAGNKIDNIIMHTFVSDYSAPLLFDFLFDFWRIDLLRNVNNLNNDEQNTEIFNELIKIMEIGNQNIRSHTSQILKFPKLRPIFKNRVKRIFKLIDDAFWNDMPIKETGNRINNLLNIRINNPKGCFRQERKRVDGYLNKTKGEILFRSPVLKMNFDTGRVYMYLPVQRLVECNEEDAPFWMIESEDFETIFKIPEYKKDNIGYYVEKTGFDIDLKDSMSNFKITLRSADKILKTYQIKSSNIRIFDKNGSNIDFNHIVSEGFVYSYSKNEIYPYVLGQKNPRTNLIHNLYLKSFDLNKGQILVLDENTVIQIGQKIGDGFSEAYPLSGLSVKDEKGEKYSVYNKLPKILFKSKPEELEGISLCINGKNHRLTKENTMEFKYSDEFDAFGYMIKLTDFINFRGIYSIYLDYPKYKKKIKFDTFCYVGNFEFKFLDSPYIFKDTARLKLKNNFWFKELVDEKYEESISINDDYKIFTFNFAERDSSKDDYCDLISGQDLELSFNLDGKLHKMCFYIPALYWKFNENDEWNVKEPQEIVLKDLKKDKKKLYLSGPFNFGNTFVYTKENIEIAEEESEIRCNDIKNPWFDLSRVYNWFSGNKEQVFRNLSIKLDNYTRLDFAKIVCRSVLVDVTLIADFDNNLLCGEVDIRGNESYTVSIYHDGKIICEDKQIVDNKFEVECDIESGIYEINVYEIEESESDGFDIETTSCLLNNKPLVKKIINIGHLKNETILLKGYQDKENKYTSFKFSSKYYISNFELKSFDDLIEDGTVIIEDDEVINLYGWEEDIDYCDQEALKRFVWYKADLKTLRLDGSLITISNVLVMLKNKTDSKSLHIFILNSDGDYTVLMIHKYSCKIVTAIQYNKYSKIDKKLTRMLYDDLNYLLFEIKEE